MKKTHLLLIVITILFYLNGFSQNPGSVSGNKLWIIARNNRDKKVNDMSSLLYNFNPVINLKKKDGKKFRNLIEKQYSLFAVFKSDFEEERMVMDILRGSTDVLITNKQVLNDNEIVYKNVDSREGFILSYLNGNNDKNGKRKNFLEIDNLFGQDDEGKEQLMELIYYPLLLPEQQRKSIETYLSIKYGISIIGNFDYLDSAATKIWDSKENGAFNKRVTGIGRDDAYNLYQKQSGNAQRDGICLGLSKIEKSNAQNEFVLKNKAFLLWGDNDGKASFTEDKTSQLKKMGKIWKVQTSGITPMDTIITQMRINKVEMNYLNSNPDKEYLWLCINKNGDENLDYSTSEYYRQSAEDDQYIYFNDIVWDKDESKSDLFTFVQGPDFFIESNTELACNSENGGIKLKIIGGTPPYDIRCNQTGLRGSKNDYEFKNLSSGKYSLSVIESKGKSASLVNDLDPLTAFGIFLNPIWYLDKRGHVDIHPTSQQDFQNFSFEWKFGTKVLSNEKHYNADKPGEYILNIISANGCGKEIPFSVKSSSSALPSSWVVHPNPVKIDQPFYLDINMEKDTNVTVRINTIEGKEILSKDLGVIKNFTFSDSINTAAVYLLTISFGTTIETVKIVVH